MKTLPFKTEVDVSFNHSFCFDGDLASLYYEDFEAETPLLKVTNKRGDVFSLIIFANENAKYKKHYSEKQLKNFEENPCALIEEWLRYDAYEYGFNAGSVINHNLNKYFAADCVEYVEKNGIDDDEYTAEDYEECKEELADMLSDLSGITAKGFIEMLHAENILPRVLEGFVASGCTQREIIDVYFYNDEARKAFDYINETYIENLFFNYPISGAFEMNIGDGTLWEAHICEYVDDAYINWNKDTKEEVINKICADIEGDEERLPYSKADRAKLAELARNWLNENVSDRLEYLN